MIVYVSVIIVGNYFTLQKSCKWSLLSEYFIFKSDNLDIFFPHYSTGLHNHGLYFRLWNSENLIHENFIYLSSFSFMEKTWYGKNLIYGFIFSDSFKSTLNSLKLFLFVIFKGLDVLNRMKHLKSKLPIDREAFPYPFQYFHWHKKSHNDLDTLQKIMEHSLVKNYLKQKTLNIHLFYKWNI